VLKHQHSVMARAIRFDAWTGITVASVVSNLSTIISHFLTKLWLLAVSCCQEQSASSNLAVRSKVHDGNHFFLAGEVIRNDSKHGQEVSSIQRDTGIVAS
jgi:hypothetical protein